MMSTAAHGASIEPEVRIYRGPKGLRELGELWRGLADAMKDRSPIHAYEWHQSFIESQEPEPEATIFVAVFSDDSLEAILPLRPVRTKLATFGRRGLEVPTNPHTPFTDIVVRDPAHMRALMPSVLRRLASEPSVSWDYILLRRTLPDSCAVRCLVAIPGFPSWARRSGAFHYHPLASYDSLLAALPSRYRKNVRRYRKRADELGVTYHTAQSREECEVLFQEFLQVEASGWKGEDGAGTAIALDPGLRRFYEALMQRFGDRGQCRICVIRHEARPIAAGFGLALNQTAYRMKWAYDESYARISPGTLLHWHILENACDDPNLRWLNMISDAPWHIQWAPITDDVHDIAVFRPGLAGRIASTEQEVLSQVRMWRRRAIDRWIVTEGGRRRIAWPSRRLA